MECESCGKKIEDGQEYLVLIEGAKLLVCKECSLLGKILSYPQSTQSKKEQKTSNSRVLSEEYELVDNFGQKIYQARQRLKIPLAVLAERLSQKESFLERIEKEKTIPPLDLVKKIEKELGIKLLVETSNNQAVGDIDYSSKKTSDLTLGDIIEIEKKKKK